MEIKKHNPAKLYKHKETGREYTKHELMRITGCSRSGIKSRLRTTNFEVTDHLLRPCGENNTLYVIDNDVKKSLGQIAREYGKDYHTVYMRYKTGKKYRTIEKLVAPSYSL